MLFDQEGFVGNEQRYDDPRNSYLNEVLDRRTGIPLVDAGMRELWHTGWMHNRVRMIVASFLIKDLRIDWQSGERYFMQHLLDADVAANNGNWHTARRWAQRS